MMSRVLRKVVRARVNYERARAFNRPVLHSMHPTALLVGYSVHEIDGVSVMIESNQLRNGTSEPSERDAFTLRSWSEWSDHELEWRLHTIDDLMLRGEGTDDERRGWAHGAINQRERSTFHVRIDDEPVEVEAIAIDGRTYASTVLAHRTLVTWAVPSDMMWAGFSSAIDSN